MHLSAMILPTTAITVTTPHKKWTTTLGLLGGVQNCQNDTDLYNITELFGPSKIWLSILFV